MAGASPLPTSPPGPASPGLDPRTDAKGCAMTEIRPPQRPRHAGLQSQAPGEGPDPAGRRRDDRPRGRRGAGDPGRDPRGRRPRGRGRGFGPREVLVRINALDTPYGEADLAAIAPAGPDAIVVPKVTGPDALVAVGSRLRRLGAPDGTRTWAMIESPMAILHLAEIASSARDVDTRLACLMVGPNDLAKASRLRLGGAGPPGPDALADERDRGGASLRDRRDRRHLQRFSRCGGIRRRVRAGARFAASTARC